MFASLDITNLVIIVMYGSPVWLLVCMMQYNNLRSRNVRADPPDPHLGRKAAGHFLLSLYGLMAIAGVSVSAAGWATQAADVNQLPSAPTLNADPVQRLAELEGRPPPPPPPAPAWDWFDDQQRLAAGLVVSGLVHGLLFYAILRLFTNDREFPAVGRAFAGVRFVSAGLVAGYCSTAALVLVFAQERDLRALLGLTAVGAVWGPAAAAYLVWLLWSSDWHRPRRPV